MTQASMPNVDPAKTHIAREFKHKSPLVSCRFDPTGKWVVAGSQDMKVVRWSLADGKATELTAHDSWVRGLAFARTKEGDAEKLILLTGGYDGRIVWWDASAEAPQPLRKIDAHKGWLRSLTVTADQQFVISCGNDNRAKLWRIADGSLVREFVGHEAHVYNSAVHPDGKQLATVDLKCNVLHWELETGKLVRQFKAATLHKYDGGFMADYGGFHAMEFSPDGKLLAGSGITNVTNAFAGVGNVAVAVLDWDGGKEQTVHVAKAPINGDGWGMALHPQPFIIGLSGGGAGGRLYFWKHGEKNEFFTFGLPSSARGLSLSPDLVHLATAHHDGAVRILKMADKT